MKRTSVELDSGCIYISGAVEFDDRPGPVRDALASSVNTWLSAMRRAIQLAMDEGHLRADLDAGQLAFEIHALILGAALRGSVSAPARFGAPRTNRV